MIITTIHCRLVAPELIRRRLWDLMADSNTPLINDLLKQVGQHSALKTWQSQGTISEATVKELCEPLKATYPGQPGRFYASAISGVTDIYKSWLALHKAARRRLNRKQRWLNAVKSDIELLELSNSTFEDLQQRAQAILSQLNEQVDSSNHSSLITCLFEAYEATNDSTTKCALSYLIKNGGKLLDTEEDPEKFVHRIHRKEKEIEQLEAKLKARLPKGRDLTGEEFLETLAISTQQLPESIAQKCEWQAKMLTQPASLPYPISYDSTDVRWSKTAKGRITVNFNGINKYLKAADPEIQKWFKTHKEDPFHVYCDQRQLPFFQRFLEDWQVFSANKNTYPTGVLTLNSALLGWREGEGQGDPWNVNHLVLYCSFDTRLMTAEGTLEVQQEKIAKAVKKLSRTNPDPRNQSTLDRLENLPDRPSRKPYQGNPEILVGLSIGLANPVTAAVINGRTGKVLTYRTPSTLLGEHYHLLNQHRQQQQQNASQRHKNQKRGVTYQPAESELGKYVDRLLAKAVVQLAQTYQAGSIVVPNLTNFREFLNSEITARAEQKCPGSVEAQNKYAKRYREAIHEWSYNRLIEAIHSKAQQLGIPVESGFQPLQGTPQELARNVAITAFHSRMIPAQ